MKKYATLCCALLFVGNSIKAQMALPQGDAQKKLEKIYAPTPFAPGQCRFIGFSNPPGADLSWLPSLSKVSENESEDDVLLEKIKAQKNKLKLNTANGQQGAAERTTTLPSIPIVGKNFEGIDNGGGNTPLDNTMAISNAGKIVAFVNSKVVYYDTVGAASYTNDIWTMVGDSTLVNNVCDPKVIYDNVADRFIFYVQVCDQRSADSRIVLGFSKSNDPAAGWWIYELSGNPLSDGSWFDYPKLAISDSEVFVTGNLFFEGAGFNQSVIYQLGKYPCYSGGTLTAQYWSGLASTFTVLPVSMGQTGSYGPGIYLVNTAGSTSGTTAMHLFVITNTMASGVDSLYTYDVTTANYSAAGNASQSGTSYQLNTGDCRSLDGFYLNGVIHFVFNTDAGSGWCGVCYNRLTVATATNTSSVFGASGTIDRCYPALASIATSATDKSVMIAYNESGPAIFPRTCAVLCDNTMTWSTPTIVKAGSSYVHYSWSTTATDRWGDYTGICRKYNDAGGTAWMAGMYGSSANMWLQWIAQLKLGANTHVGVEEVNPSQDQVKVFPNPVYEDCSIQFTLKERGHISISIIDMQGKVVKDLYSTIAEAGENVFSFNKANLSPGVYFVHITGNSTLIHNEKIVIAGK